MRVSLVLLASLVMFTATVVAAQTVAPGGAANILTVGLVTTVFLAGGGFFVTKYKADAAHARLDAHKAEEGVERGRVWAEVRRLNQQANDNHVILLTVMHEMENRLAGRINAASDTTPGFNRRAQPRPPRSHEEAPDVGADTDTKD